jgi:hypothetical protein
MEILREIHGTQTEFTLDTVNQRSLIYVDQMYGIETEETSASPCGKVLTSTSGMPCALTGKKSCHRINAVSSWGIHRSSATTIQVPNRKKTSSASWRIYPPTE